MSKREIFVFLIFGVAVVYGLRYPLVACCLFTWNNIFRPISWGNAYNSVTLWSHHICFGVLIASIILNPWRRRWHAGSTLFLVVLAWVWLCALFAVHVDLAVESATDISKYMIPLAIVGATLRDRKAQEVYLYVLAASVGIHLVWAGFHGAILKGGIEDKMGISGGQMTGRNNFTVSAAACLPLLAYTAFYYDWKWRGAVRWVVRVLLIPAVAAFFYSGSRGAVLGVTSLLLWWAFMSGRPLKRVGTAVLIVVIAIPLIPDFVWDRMETLTRIGTDEMDGSTKERLEVMKLGVEMTLKNPIVGVGPENSWKVASDLGYRPDRPGEGIEMHVIWLTCSSEYGIPMLLFFVTMIGTLLWRLRRTARWGRDRGDRKTEGLATALSCAIVGNLVAGTFTSGFLSEYLWSILALTLAFLTAEREGEAVETDRLEEFAAVESAGTVTA